VEKRQLELFQEVPSRSQWRLEELMQLGAHHPLGFRAKDFLREYLEGSEESGEAG
jgi:hypothetical protein